eukprot:Nk52_evm26s2474 gene=Nk52_evmTU26s2474
MSASGERLVFIVMGVCGCGKSAVGALLAKELGWAFEDADHYHSEANVEKMRRGLPLTDTDRKGLLDSISRLVHSEKMDGNFILACSCLKKKYREAIANSTHRNSSVVYFIYLKCTDGALRRRLHERTGHFMKANMLDSQLATLEEPGEEELSRCHTVHCSTEGDRDRDMTAVVKEAVQYVHQKQNGLLLSNA